MGVYHTASLVIGAGQFFAYVLLSSLIQYRFYHQRAHSPHTWKSNPRHLSRVNHSGHSFIRYYCWPLLSLVDPRSERDGDRHGWHPLIATVNLMMSATFAASVAEAHLRGLSSLTTASPLSLATVLLPLLLSLMWQNVAEYYWHRVMHWPWMYRHLHKLHHHYKSPQPFDDLFIHPLEAFGYYCILYAPAMIVRQPLVSFLLYMSVMGLCGVLDHCGVRFQTPVVSDFARPRSVDSRPMAALRGLVRLLDYDTKFHDEHHRLFNVNFAFPFPIMDVLHGTHRWPDDNDSKPH